MGRNQGLAEKTTSQLRHNSPVLCEIAINVLEMVRSGEAANGSPMVSLGAVPSDERMRHGLLRSNRF
jgi:hypothetical protein